ncbi:MAG: hypothetical protein PVJ72_10480, partial [Gammaproteobacteria bacterium]
LLTSKAFAVTGGEQQSLNHRSGPGGITESYLLSCRLTPCNFAKQAATMIEIPPIKRVMVSKPSR